ncbi:BolA family protein [Marinobacter litoralis]|uniref:BolA family protein n=1 Tax=Marinobacter litoralis TaxID=187981 RepID=UPI0018EC71FF|nr:BolA/IbaG family iron-sulfur metabolism protein [Marinobacter litoralis]MBJ6138857.1 BolA/IbaG family iron-sulfur metabolism protein [Marinobacter litoralis]
MQVQSAIETKLANAFEVKHLAVENESHMHSVPPNSETHFKVTLVSDGFDGVMKVKRHQMIYKVLAEELAGPVHALALHLYTPEEWAKTGQAAPDSPNCMGGSKGDAAMAAKLKQGVNS